MLGRILSARCRRRWARQARTLVLLMVTSVLTALSMAWIAEGGTEFGVVSAFDFLTGASRRRMPASGVRGHCRRIPTEICDSDNGGGGAEPCSSSSPSPDVCEFFAEQWEDTSGNPRAYVDGGSGTIGGLISQSWNGSSGQRAMLFGGTSGSIFSFTDTGWFGINSNPLGSAQFGCSNYVYYANGAAGGKTTAIGNFADVCASPPQYPAQLSAINTNSANAAHYAETPLGAELFRYHSPVVNDDPNYFARAQKIITTDGTASASSTLIPTANGQAYQITIWAIARCSGGTCAAGQTGSWQFTATAVNTGATLTIVDDESAYVLNDPTNVKPYSYAFTNITSMPARPAGILASGQNILAQAQGKTGATIVWSFTAFATNIAL